MQRRKLPWSAVIGYGVGDIFGGGSTTTINMFYLFFLTDVARIDPGPAGIVCALTARDLFVNVLSPGGSARGFALIGVVFAFVPFVPPGEVRRSLCSSAFSSASGLPACK